MTEPFNDRIRGLHNMARVCPSDIVQLKKVNDKTNAIEEGGIKQKIDD